MPRFLLGLAIVFWGWQTGFWIVALPIAVVVEAGRWNQQPWALEAADFRRMANLCVVLLLGLFGYLVVAQLWMESLYRFLLWLPLIFLPLILAQVYSTEDQVPLKSLFLFFAKDVRLRHTRLDLRYPYFAVCLLSASAVANIETQILSYYLGMTGLVGAWLFFHRLHLPGMTRRAAGLSLACFICAASLGFVAQNGVHQLHLQLENQAIQWLSGFLSEDLNPAERDTAIGKVGSLKLSNQIRFRVQGKNVPPLLREATYNRYQAGMWVAIEADFFPVATDDSATQWDLRPNAQQFNTQQFNTQQSNTPQFNTQLLRATLQTLNTAPEDFLADPTVETIVIHDRLPRKKGLIKLPQTAQVVQAFPASGMNRNPYGTVAVESESEAISYQVAFLPEAARSFATLDRLPTAADLEVPPLEKPALNLILQEVSLAPSLPPPATADRLIQFFQDNFRYSLDLIEPPSRSAALEDFLLNHRSGHCEYFATAMTLLLRELGIPARYAVGFSVHEFSPLEGQYVVRARHAHAWTIAYWQDHWVALDPTPSDWRSSEAEAVPAWRKLQDFSDWLRFAVMQGFQSLRESDLLRRWWWLAIPVVFFYLRQLNQRRRVIVQTPAAERETLPPDYPGTHSPFYAVMERWQQKGWIREPAETLKQWFDRLQDQFPDEEDWPHLRSALEQHYRDRFG